MMTSASTYSGYPPPSPSPCPSATLPTSLDDCVADDDMPVTTTASLRLVKRSLPFTTDNCKKRRKQSTPIRISTSSVDAPDDTSLSLGIGLCYEGKLGPSQFLPHSPLDQDRVSPAPTALPPSEEPLLTHPDIKLEYSPGPDTASPDSIPVNLSGGQNFPPWLSDVQSKANDWLNVSLPPSTGNGTIAIGTSINSTISNQNTFYVPMPVTTSVNTSQSLRTSSQAPIRIFNPEAYCELCNKEFCNKYFLKTHKANKHRIYTDPPTSDTVSLPVNVPTFTASLSSMKKPTPSILTTPEVPTFKTIDVQNKLHFNEVNTPIDLMHVFCDLCGKSFANKMLLKAHKNNVHGIPSEQEPTSDDIEINRSLFLSVQKEERETEIGDSNLNITESGIGEKENIAYKDESIPLAAIDQDESSENTVTLNSQITLQQRDRESLDFVANRSRRLGIMNPEAFCEICCKEYCNKYFLRTHKMKRHGILIPDENSKDNQKDFKLELSISNNWYQIQTSPLNLIMAEQNTNSSGSCSEQKSSPANENECEICGMRFQTLYLAQLHFATVHSQNKSISNNDDFTNTLNANNNEKHAPDSISEDLQKLQTMILQLNDLDVSKLGASTSGSVLNTCSMCGKEFENKYYLHAHLMTEHGVLLDNNTNIPEKKFETDIVNDNNSEILQQQNSECQSQLKNLANSTPVTSGTSTLTISTSSSISGDKKDDSNGFVNFDKVIRNNSNNSNGTSSAIPERRSSVSLTPTNSYCEICNKELCNKYFMKTHMQRMHGIEIENGAQIGGVVCNICNKELCSKYFLRVHKHNTHGIVQDNIGVNSNQPRHSSIELEHPPHTSTSTKTDVPLGTSVDTSLKLGDLSDLSNRYFTHFTEVCTICSRRFRSTKWLKAHLLGDHGKAGSEKWNELEIQLQQSFGQQQQQQGQHRKSSTPGDRSSPTLRIPNGGQNNIKSESNMQNVLSSIFGTDETNVKQYHCSFCSFSTPVLAFLFVHERSHSQSFCESTVSGTLPCNSSNSGNNSSSNALLYCAVCNQSFRQPNQLHHHIVSQHPFLALNPFFGNVRPQPQTTESKQDVSSVTEASPEMPNVDQQIEHKCSKCTQCGRAKKQQQTEISTILKSDMLSTDVTITLKDVSKQRQLPATYALPQHQQKTKYMMQAFLMDEPNSEVTSEMVSGTGSAINANTPTTTGLNVSTAEDAEEELNSSENGNTTTPDRKFAPSIVFLPVLEKLTAPLTVSFTLTPA